MRFTAANRSEKTESRVAQAARQRLPLDVVITIDTEFSPRDFHDWNVDIESLVARDVDGVTPQGSFGIGFQMDRLDHWGLKAVFQVEALSASAVGPGILRRIVEAVRSRGHGVEMHVHAEWLAAVDLEGLPPFRGRNLTAYSADEQTRILERALANLHAAGARDIRAFRAGNYGANRDTLLAVERNGLPFDSSYNVCYLDAGWPESAALTGPTAFGGVCELPIAFFHDWPGHARPAQLCACSSTEMQHALLEAWKSGWPTFVIVSHSFELIRRPQAPGKPARPDRTVIRRMEELFRFLAVNRDKFRTTTFTELDAAAFASTGSPPPPVRSPIAHTVRRAVEQLLGRFS